MFPVKEYHYQQTGLSAVQCSGQIGVGITILDACLVNGFGVKSVTSISVSSNIATVTTATAHGYLIGEIVAIAGANESVFNSEFRIIDVPTTTSFTVACVTALTSATGTISVKNSGLGWQKVYSGTNKAVYRSQDVTGTRLYLRVDDSVARYLAVTMYETMTSVDVGTGASPTRYWYKSNVASAATRPWYLIGDSKRFYFITDWDTTNYPGLSDVVAFGDFNSMKAGDGYNCLLIGQTSSASAYANQYSDFSTILSSTAVQGQHIARSYTQVGTTVSFYKWSVAVAVNMGIGTYVTYPNGSDNGLHLTPVQIYENSAKTWRGTMPGLRVSLESVGWTFPNRDKTVIIDGKTYIGYRIMSGTGSQGYCWFDYDGAW